MTTTIQIHEKRKIMFNKFKKQPDTTKDFRENDFIITNKECKEIDKWISNHIKQKHHGNSYAGAIGGRFTYQFIPTSIGTVGEIICSCGEKFCFRDLF